MKLLKNFLSPLMLAIILGIPHVLQSDHHVEENHTTTQEGQKSKQKEYDLFTYHAADENPYPAELSMMIIDLKYDDSAPQGQQIKICELGDGFTSRYKGFDALYGIGGIWSRFWIFLKTFQTPTWFIDLGRRTRFESFYAIDDFYNVPGVFAHTLTHLEANAQFRKQRSKNGRFDHKKLSSYSNFIIKKYGTTNHTNAATFRIKHPDSLILSEATRHYTNNKYQTTKLFTSPSVSHLRPKFGAYRKMYTTDLAHRIIQNFGCDTFVIKPINAALGHGIIMVTKEELDDTLEKILKGTKDLGKHIKDPAYTYWKRDHNRIFIVEEYAPSKVIYTQGKPYDATMRIVVSAWNDNGHANLTFLGAYWKLPMYPLNEPKVSFTDLHKSNVKRGSISSAPVSDEDFYRVTTQLCEPLCKLYLKMLKNRSGRRNFRSQEDLNAMLSGNQEKQQKQQSDEMKLLQDACIEIECEHS